MAISGDVRSCRSTSAVTMYGSCSQRHFTARAFISSLAARYVSGLLTGSSDILKYLYLYEKRIETTRTPFSRPQA